MPRKLAVIAATGIAASIVLIGAAAVIDGPKLANADWGSFNIGMDRCERVDGATATSRFYDWSGEDRITIAVPANVHYRPGGGDRIEVHGDPQGIAHLRVHKRRIDMECDGFRGKGLDITLPGGRFRKFTLAGSGNLDLDQLDQSELEVSIAGSGKIVASGKADRVEIDIAGSGDALMGRLDAREVDIEIAGSGNAEVAPRDEAKIRIAGSGDVRLVTDPRDIDSKIFGSGRITRGAGHSALDAP